MKQHKYFKFLPVKLNQTRKVCFVAPLLKTEIFYFYFRILFLKVISISSAFFPSLSMHFFFFFFIVIMTVFFISEAIVVVIVVKAVYL